MFIQNRESAEYCQPDSQQSLFSVNQVEPIMPLTLKVVFIGDTKVGKTSVLRRLLGEAFDPTFIMTTARGR